MQTMSVIWTGIVVIVLVGWFAYRKGVERGMALGYEAGLHDGVKKGKDDGMKAGIKAGIKQQLINTLAGQPAEGNYAELQKQVRQEMLETLNAKQSPRKEASPPKPDLLRVLWQKLGAWFLLCLLIALIAYLAR